MFNDLVAYVSKYGFLSLSCLALERVDRPCVRFPSDCHLLRTDRLERWSRDDESEVTMDARTLFTVSVATREMRRLFLGRRESPFLGIGMSVPQNQKYDVFLFEACNHLTWILNFYCSDVLRATFVLIQNGSKYKSYI